jgi:hypothetical protein
MRRILSLLSLSFFHLILFGQTPVGSWSDHLVYSTANSVAVSSDQVFASTGTSILIYNKQYAELKKMSRITGLSETGISTIAWSEENKTLIIAYKNTDVDLLKNNVIYNIPDILRKYIPGKKIINKIRTNGRYAYLTSSFGIIVIDLVKREINDTWKPGIDADGAEIFDIAFGNEKVFASTAIGVFTADITNAGLSYFGNWDRINSLPDPASKYTSLVFSGNKLYANQSGIGSSGDKVYAFDNSALLFSFTPGVTNTSFDLSGTGFTISSSGFVKDYNSNGALSKTISSYGFAEPQISQAVVDNNDIWIADIKSGLIMGANMDTFSALTLPGPVSNDVFNITSLNGETVICRGGTDNSWTSSHRSLAVSVYENNSWTSISSGTIFDPVRAVIDPGNNNHIFVSTWGYGLLEYENNNLIKQYTEANSPLQPVIPARVKIFGMAFDNSKNLWITQTGAQGSIKVLKPDGSWVINPLTIDAPEIGDILITSKGQKWIILPKGNGLFVMDDNNTPDVFNDDKFRKFQVHDEENQPVSFVYSFAEDLDGNVWIGTDQGPLIYFNPESIIDNSLNASHILIPRNDGTNLADILLKTETITSIAIDGANRKWLGTAGSGAYLLAPDGKTQIKNFNVLNSPIFSDSIISLAVDNKTGDVWFATSKGVQSYRSEATGGAEKFSRVLTFPNPVREDFTGNVTITGLMKDTRVKITDISGNLVYETVSEGGTATWDLTTYNGRRVSTGVYIIFCASKDGSQSHVSKMLVIH